MAFEKSELLFILDALGNHTLTQIPAHVDHGADDRPIASRHRIDRLDERLVDVEHVDRELVQVTQAGVPRAEVVHGNLHPHRLEFAQQGGARCDIVHQDAFSQLELYMGPIYTGDIEDRNCVREKVPMGSRRGNEHGRENLVV